jgi:hypothetical protein
MEAGIKKRASLFVFCVKWFVFLAHLFPHPNLSQRERGRILIREFSLFQLLLSLWERAGGEAIGL